MKMALKLLFSAIFLWMTVLTVRTSLAVSLWSAWDSFAGNPWAVATLYDAYFGFITFWGMGGLQRKHPVVAPVVAGADSWPGQHCHVALCPHPTVPAENGPARGGTAAAMNDGLRSISANTGPPTLSGHDFVRMSRKETPPRRN